METDYEGHDQGGVRAGQGDQLAAAGGSPSTDLLESFRTHSFAETRFEPAEYFPFGIASTERGSP